MNTRQRVEFENKLRACTDEELREQVREYHRALQFGRASMVRQELARRQTAELAERNRKG